MDVSADAILSIIAAEARLAGAALKPDATLIDLDISSIDLVSIIFELEDQFGLEIQPEDISPTATIAELIEHVLSLQPK